MPGHKGNSFLGCESLDITEIDGADVLGSASGIIAQSENNASELFGSEHTFYSTEGSTLAIKAMLALIKRKAPISRRTKILAVRNVHKAFIYACALLDIDAQWIYPAEFSHLCNCKISAEELDEALSVSDTLPDAVYITSPDYLGSIADIKGLSAVCHRYGIPLLVDNAHGAYLAFCSPSLHPLALGADMCCDSAHKTLPVLTGGAYLHISKNYSVNEAEARNMLSLFASTSPSYLTLQSLDLCNAYIANGYAQKLKDCTSRMNELKVSLASKGFDVEKSEALKLVISAKSHGYSGVELATHLRKFSIEAEYADRDILVLMATPELSCSDFVRLERALDSLERKHMHRSEYLALPKKPQRALSFREAILSESETVSTASAVGRICACPTVSCPPAVPIVMSGEIIDLDAIELMAYYGIKTVEIIKQKIDGN